MGSVPESEAPIASGGRQVVSLFEFPAEKANFGYSFGSRAWACSQSTTTSLRGSGSRATIRRGTAFATVCGSYGLGEAIDMAFEYAAP